MILNKIYIGPIIYYYIFIYFVRSRYRSRCRARSKIDYILGFHSVSAIYLYIYSTIWFGDKFDGCRYLQQGCK